MPLRCLPNNVELIHTIIIYYGKIFKWENFCSYSRKWLFMAKLLQLYAYELILLVDKAIIRVASNDLQEMFGVEWKS